MLLCNQEDMNRRDGLDVMKSKYQIILVNFSRRDLPTYDPAKQTVTHG